MRRFAACTAFAFTLLLLANATRGQDKKDEKKDEFPPIAIYGLTGRGRDLAAAMR